MTTKNSKQEPLTDKSPMPFGKAHKGERMIDIPARYLLWFHDSVKSDDFSASVHAYVDANIEVIRSQVERQSYNEK